MKPYSYLLAAAVAAALLAGCDRGEPTASSKAPTTASGGASGASPRTTPAGDSVPVPPAPKGSGDSETKPDPGDANDHSNPQHDAKKKSDG